MTIILHGLTVSWMSHLNSNVHVYVLQMQIIPIPNEAEWHMQKNSMESWLTI